jgi:phenylalanyl-tRNA synthetase alpha subunit
VNITKQTTIEKFFFLPLSNKHTNKRRRRRRRNIFIDMHFNKIIFSKIEYSHFNFQFLTFGVIVCIEPCK